MASVINPYWIRLGIEIGEELYESDRHILVLSGADKRVLDDIGAVVKREFGRRLEFFSKITVLNGNGSNGAKITNLLTLIRKRPNKTQYPNTPRYFMVKDQEGELERSGYYKTIEEEVYPIDASSLVKNKQDKEEHYWMQQAREIARALIRNPQTASKDDIPYSRVIFLKGGKEKNRRLLMELLQEELPRRHGEVFWELIESGMDHVDASRELGRRIEFGGPIIAKPKNGVYKRVEELESHNEKTEFTFVISPKGLFNPKKPYHTLEERAYSVDIAFFEEQLLK